MRIKTFGWRNQQLDQITRIEQGLINLGHQLVDDSPYLIYCNNDFYDEAIEYSKKYPDAIRIFNILDLQLHNSNFDFNKLKEQLLFANKVTCISDFVKKEIKEHLNIDAIDIGNPIKDVSYIPEIKKEIDLLIVGRNADKNKRGNIFEDLLRLNDSMGKSYGVVGSEPLPNIRRGWMGVLKDDELNEVYNMSKFVICPSKREGLNLVMLEALVTSIPLVAQDMTTSYLIPKEFHCEPTAESFNNKINEINKDYDYYKNIAFEYGKQVLVKYNKNQIAQNIINLVK